METEVTPVGGPGNFGLDEEQLRFFEVFGFLRFPGLFADEIAAITESFGDIYQRHANEVVEWVHPTHENRMRRFIPNFIERDEQLAGLLHDHRVTGTARALMGDDYTFRGSDGSIYDCGTVYHRDSYGADLSFCNVKMALYLDPIDANSGAIRLIPGSQHMQDQFTKLLNQNLLNPAKRLALATEEVPATILCSEPGDLLLWDYRVLHATSYGGNQRRMLALEFSEPYGLPQPEV